MKRWNEWKSGIQPRLATVAAVLAKRRAILLIGLFVLAALPGLIQFGNDEGNEQNADVSPFDRARAGRDSSAATDSRSDPLRMAESVRVEWESYSNFDEPENEPDPVDFDCMIEPWETVAVRSAVIGRIDAIHVERADVVAKDDLLVELDADLSKAELEMARQRASMTASIHALEARTELGSKRSKRALELVARNAMAIDEHDEVMTEKTVSEYDLEDARDQYKLAQLQLARERARFEQRRIRSPFDGVVADRMMSVGEVVDEETVLEIARIDPLRVELILPAAEFGNITRGMKAAVVPEIPGDEVLVATVRVVDRVIDSASGTFGAELELPNPDHGIPGGLRCRVRFEEPPMVGETPHPTDAHARKANLDAEKVAHAEPSDS